MINAMCTRNLTYQLSYVPQCTALHCTADLSGGYEESNFALDSSYLWITLLLNICVCYAFTTLYHFYHAFSYLLRAHNPIEKFLCIKFVIFIAFWQGIVIQILIATRVLRGTDSYTTEQLSATLQDMLICFEMFIISVAHIRAFTYL